MLATPFARRFAPVTLKGLKPLFHVNLFTHIFACGRPANPARGPLFADAEAGKDGIEDVLDVDPAGDAAQRMGGLAQVLGAQLEG